MTIDSVAANVVRESRIMAWNGMDVVEGLDGEGSTPVIVDGGTIHVTEAHVGVVGCASDRVDHIYGGIVSEPVALETRLVNKD